MSTKPKGPPKHQNKYTWDPQAFKKKNETEVGGKLRPYSEITGVCMRCKEQIEWKRKYGKYKPLTEPAKCQRCSKRAVRQAHHKLCQACAKEHKVCAKCSCCVDRIIGRDLSEVEAEQKALEEAIKNARERDRRTLLRAMNRGKSQNASKDLTDEGNKAGESSPAADVEGHDEETRDDDEESNGDKKSEEDGSKDDDDEGDGGKDDDDGEEGQN